MLKKVVSILYKYVLILLLFVCMKNILILFFVFFISCQGKDEGISIKSYFKLSTNTLIFDSNGGKQDVYIETNVEWEVDSLLPDWINIEYNSEGIVSFYIEPNDGYSREHEVLFLSEHEQYVLLIKQKERAVLSFVDNEIFLEFEEFYFDININQNIPYKVQINKEGLSWLSRYTKYGNISFEDVNIGSLDENKLTFQVKENDTNLKRMADIVIYNDIFHLSDTIKVIQNASRTERYMDGQYVVIQQIARSNANLVLLGDGFVRKDLLHEGEYHKSMAKALEHFFSIEPYKSYREYFNVYMVVAESEEEGVGEKNLIGGSTVNNKFGTAYGSGTEIVCNDELIFEYARKVKELPEDKPITVLVVLNSNKYAGTAYLYANGNSIALCPMSTAEPPNDFEGIVHHEAGGHAFGFLLDEYVYNQSEMPEERKKEIQEWQKLGYQMNLDFTNDLSKIIWKDFVGIDKYAPVGAYEGGYEYQFGVWRSEENSCMNNNIPYYNVQSRWSIVKRIMDLSDVEFTVQDFIKNDNPVYPTDGRALSNRTNFIPLGNPVWVK